MNEIANVTLENEMDLILAHKQSMRLAELAGLSLSAQTTFATAVSEVSRNAIGAKNNAFLKLYISGKKDKIKFISAILEDKREGFLEHKDEGYAYAKRLVSNISATKEAAGNKIELNYRLATAFRVDDELVERLRVNLNTNPEVSPYEEIKRKNRQLIELAEKLRRSEQQYRTLTDSLPIMIFTLMPDASLVYANQWLTDYTGQTMEELNETGWKDVTHPEDFAAIDGSFLKRQKDAQFMLLSERRIKNKDSREYRWHTGVSIAIMDEDGSKRWNTFLVDIHAQKMIEQALTDNQELKKMQLQLEDKVKLLNQSNHQLAQFAYIASHDLQEPLRKISFYSDFLSKRFSHHIPDEAKTFFDSLISATERMKVLIHDVLSYSTISKNDFESVDLNEIAADALQDLEIGIKEKNAVINIGILPVIEGYRGQMKQLFENLISNALKFSKLETPPAIDISCETDNNTIHLSFKDNGIGFDEQYKGKMFDVFQKLHSKDKYAGTGIGLAICRKIIELHNGTITATSTTGNGAIFVVTLPQRQIQHFEEKGNN